MVCVYGQHRSLQNPGCCEAGEGSSLLGAILLFSSIKINVLNKEVSSDYSNNQKRYPDLPKTLHIYLLLINTYQLQKDKEK